MKKKILFGAAFLFVAWAATSCNPLTDCQFCKTISTDSRDGSVNESTTETEYCGAILVAIKIKSVTVGTVTTTYKCR
jgi:hypothetical protein